MGETRSIYNNVANTPLTLLCVNPKGKERCSNIVFLMLGRLPAVFSYFHAPEFW